MSKLMTLVFNRRRRVRVRGHIRLNLRDKIRRHLVPSGILPGDGGAVGEVAALVGGAHALAELWLVLGLVDT